MNLREKIEKISDQISMVERAQAHYIDTHNGQRNADLDKAIKDLESDKARFEKLL